MDITEQKQGEEELRTSEHFLQRIHEVTPGVVQIFDLEERRSVFINRSVAALIGYTPEEISAMGSEVIARLMHPDDVPRFHEHLGDLRTLADGQIAVFEHRMRDASGAWHWFHSRDAVFTRDARSAVRQIVGTAMEITERKNVEETLRASEQRMRLATEATRVGIWEWNVITGFIRWDAQMFRIYGVAPTVDGFVSYDTWSRAVVPEDLPQQEEVLMDTVRRRGQSAREFRILRGEDGECRWIQAVETVRTNHEGEAEWVIGTNLDITAQKHAERAILEEAKRKDEFLAMLGHELRNPLNAIRHDVQISAESADDPASVQWAGQVIDRQSQQLARMVDDLLDVARINRGRFELRVESLDLRPVLEQAADGARALLEQRRHTLAVEIGEGLHVTGDAARLVQIFVNLLTNAAKYTPEGGRLQLRAWSEDAHVLASISDNGCGIPAELLPHVFDLFRQAESNLDRAQGGLGIGLSVVKSLVEMHLGRVVVESAGVNQGTTVTVRLPLLVEARTAVLAPTLSSSRAAAQNAIRVLIVDDHEDAAQALGRLLTRRGCEIRLAFTGPEGLTAAREFHPEILLLDLSLPGFDGYELARHLRAEGPFSEALLIAISGYAQGSDRERCLAAGFDDHFAKPIDFPALMEVIHARLPVEQS